MSLNRYAKRRDENEPEIISALERAGCHVQRLDTPFDLLVSKSGSDYKIEVKMPRAKLTPAQVDYIADNKGAPVHVVTSAEQALEIVSHGTR